ncbi:kelch domain-containing protein 3 [Balamuthia mandrillaris]
MEEKRKQRSRNEDPASASSPALTTTTASTQRLSTSSQDSQVQDRYRFELLGTTGELPSERYGQTAICYKGHLYLFGGCDKGGAFLEDFYQLDLGKRDWTKLTVENGPRGRHFHSMVLYRNALYVFGGKSNGYMNDLYCFNLATQQWRCVEGKGKNKRPTKRYGHVAAVHGQCMYIFGGYDDLGWKCNDLYAFHFEKEEWEEIETLGSPPYRFHSTGSVFQGSLYVFGGYPDVRDLFEYRFASKTWSLVKTTGEVPSERWGHREVVHKDVMYIFGGCDPNTCCDVHAFHFATRQWELLEVSGCPERCFHSLTKYKEEVFLFGGKNTENECYNDLYCFSFENEPEERVCTFTSDFGRMVNSPEYSDILFLFPKDKNKRLHAHKNIIYARCPQLYKSCCSDEDDDTEEDDEEEEEEEQNKDHNKKHQQLTKVTITDISYSTFYQLLLYLYTGSPEVDSSFNITNTNTKNNKPTKTGFRQTLALLKTAHRFQLEYLKALCGENLIKGGQVTRENVAYLYKQAHKYQVTNLQSCCLEWILAHYDSIKSELKNQLPPDLLQTIRKASLERRSKKISGLLGAKSFGPSSS